jgi:4-hydroxy-tetrahydrodipicolinate synthase
MLTRQTLHGSYVALVTPFVAAEGAIDEVRLRELIEWQIAEGTDGIVVAGTTGESATLSHTEHRKLVSLVIQEVAGRVPVIAGAGSNNTLESVALAEHAKDAGADAILAISPYYNKPTQDGIIAHYERIAVVGIPLVLYNVPGRTGRNVEVATTLTLAQNPQILGIKEASGNLAQVKAICEKKPADFVVLSGEDCQTVEIMELGGKGVIGVIVNEIPHQMKELTAAALAGDFAKAKQIQNQYLDLMQLNFADANPLDVKWALSLMQKITYGCRLPMTAPSAENKQKIEAELKKLGMI